MSRKKDWERVARGEVFRNGKISKLTKCPVPNCPRYVVTGASAHGLCPHHGELLDFLLFVLPRIQVSPGPPKAPGLILPGQAGFAVSQVIKKEAEKHGRLKP